jgi:Zn-dependent protease/CBS domain-containing protein
MKESVHLGKVRGIRVGIHWSLLLIFWLVVVSLAGSQLPHSAPGHTTGAYWFAALAAAAIFYACLLAHELAHAVVARRRNIEVEGIVLWLLGGVSKLKGEAADPDTERNIAVAGPATSVALALAFFVLSRLFGAGHPASLAAGVFGWLGWINGLLAVFNLLPAFPLDGGRILRSVLWRHNGDKRRATTTAARTGGAFGYGMIAIGVVGFVASRGGLDGLWLAIIGWFLISVSRAEAAASVRAEEFRGMQASQGLRALRVRDAMTPNPLTVPTWVTLDQLMSEGVYKRRLSSFPVVDNNRTFVGLVTLEHVRLVPAARLAETTTGSVATPAGQCVVSRPDDELDPVARRISASADHLAVVVDEMAHVVGILSDADLRRLPVPSGVHGGS